MATRAVYFSASSRCVASGGQEAHRSQLLTPCPHPRAAVRAQMPLAMGQRDAPKTDGDDAASGQPHVTRREEGRPHRLGWSRSSHRLPTGAGSARDDKAAGTLRRHSSLSLLRSPTRDQAAASASRSGAAEEAVGRAARRPGARAGHGVAPLPSPNAKGEQGYLALVVTHVALYVVAPSPAPIPRHRALFDVVTGTLIPPVVFPCTPAEREGPGPRRRRKPVCRAVHPTQFRAWRCAPMVRVLACIPLHCVEALRLGVNGQWLRADTAVAVGPSSAGVALSLVTQERHAQAEAVNVLTLLVEGARRVAARVEVQDRAAVAVRRRGAGAGAGEEADVDESEPDEEEGGGDGDGELERLAEGWGECEVSQRDVVLVRRLQRALGLSAEPKAGKKRAMGKALGMGKGGASDLRAVYAVHVRERGCEWGLRTVALTDQVRACPLVPAGCSLPYARALTPLRLFTQALAVLEDSALVGDDPGDPATPLPALELELPFRSAIPHAACFAGQRPLSPAPLHRSAVGRAGVVQGTALLAIEIPSPNRMARLLNRKRVIHLRFGTPEQAADVARVIAQGAPRGFVKEGPGMKR